MKKFIAVVFLSLLLTVPVGALEVKADDDILYTRILSDDVTLYMDANLTKAWFVLPYSYYLKILSVGTYSVKVEYKDGNSLRPSVKGYIRSQDVNLAAKEPAAPYPNSTFTIGEGCLLYKDTNFTYAETVTENSVMDFYGTLVRPDGNAYAFGFVTTASGDDYMGYVIQSAILNFSVPILPVEVVKPEESAKESLSEKEEKQVDNALGNNLQIIIIVGISVIAISIVYLLFRPQPERAKEEVVTKDVFEDE